MWLYFEKIKLKSVITDIGPFCQVQSHIMYNYFTRRKLKFPYEGLLKDYWIRVYRTEHTTVLH